jgi:cyclopropane fatty-acyl-phospholipid synthase-like methyltransferase
MGKTTRIKYLSGKPVAQTLGLYSEEAFANSLESWGKDTVWKEISLLMAPLQGRVLDIACGTGAVMRVLSGNKHLDIYGFDISEKLIERATGKGIDKTRLKVADATKQNYAEKEFDYSYSIGSLEHFTEEGIDGFLKCASIQTKIASFHMIPTQFYNRNDGWIENGQTYWNNSVEWWMEHFSRHFDHVQIHDSTWVDEGVSVGKWFVCFNER